MTKKYTKAALGMLATTLAFAVGGCRSPLDETYDSWEPQLDGEFDASVEDDGGVGFLCPEGSPDLFNNAYNPYRGGDDSVDLTVVDYSYFGCPHCSSFALDWEAIWDANPEFDSRVRMYFHHFPFSSQTAWETHAASHAAGLQGMEYFWAVHDLIYFNMAQGEGSTSVAEIRDYVESVLLLDMDQWDYDASYELSDQNDTYEFLAWDKAQGQAAGITGTPSVYICGAKIVRSQLQEIVQGYLDSGN